jgi:Holliday junction DNA helicase RuvA
MIGRLKGILAHKQPPWIVVDVHGVGYELEAPMSTFYDLPELGREVALFTHYAQKEDSWRCTASCAKPSGACSAMCRR